MPKFTKNKDINQLRALKAAYQNAFTSKELSAESKIMPKEFNVQVDVRSSMFGILSYDEASISEEITRAEISPHTFDDYSEAMTSSPMFGLTSDIICDGLDYIKSRESNWLHRRSMFNAYEDLNDARYYLIVVIAKRIKTLCKTTCDRTLIAEYDSLQKFISNIIDNHDLFPTSSTSGFHLFLSNTLNNLVKLRDRAKFLFERTTIADHLGKIADIINTYRNTLSLYLAFALTDAPLPDSLSNSMLFDPRHLSQAFIESALYISIVSALQNRPHLPIQVQTPNLGLPELLRKYEDIANLLDTYNRLLKALGNLEKVAQNYRYLSEHIVLKGEWQVAHDEGIYSLLHTNLLFVLEITAQVEEHIKLITTHTNSVFKGHEAFKEGFPLNKHNAHKKSEVLKELSSQIMGRKDDICKSVNVIQEIKADDLNAQCSVLVNNTAELITSYSQDSILTPEFAQQLLQQLSVQQSEVKEFIAPTQSIQQTEVTIQFKDRFPSIFHLIGNDSVLWDKFKSIIIKIDLEISVRSHNFLDIVNEINQICLQLNDAINYFGNLPVNQRVHADFKKIEDIFNVLQNKILEAKYHQFQFHNFKFLDRWMVTQFNAHYEESFTQIERILLNCSEYKNESPKSEELWQKIGTEIQLQYANKKGELAVKIRNIKATLAVIQPAETDISLIDHYTRIISDHRPASPLPHNLQASKDSSVQSGPAVANIATYDSYLSLCTSLLTDEYSCTLKIKLDELYRRLREQQYKIKFGGETVIVNDKEKKGTQTRQSYAY